VLQQEVAKKDNRHYFLYRIKQTHEIVFNHTEGKKNDYFLVKGEHTKPVVDVSKVNQKKKSDISGEQI
jgi:hypothetical protein